MQALFANKPILFLGGISYGVYLSHVPLIALFGKLEMPFMGNPMLKFLFVGICATAVSTVTYYLIERPGLAYGKVLGGSRRWRSIFSSNRPAE